MNNLIQWPRAQYWDKPWNPIVGCKPCSPACENCYAAEWAHRFGQSFKPHATAQRPPRKGVVFCGNMTDLFGEWRTCGEMAKDVLGTIRPPATSRATYLWLTKRVGRMAEAVKLAHQKTFWPGCAASSMYTNHYFGFTAGNQEWYDSRIGAFRGEMPTWANCWLSAEPLLGRIDLGLRYIAPEDMPFDWVVVGCESGRDRRPCKIEWVESIVEQCRSAGVSVFVKQLDINGKCERDITKFPEHLRTRQVPWAKEGEAR